jgi:hypothetical protein
MAKLFFELEAASHRLRGLSLLAHGIFLASRRFGESLKNRR